MAKITGNLTGAHSISVELTPKKTLSGSISSGGGKVKSVNGMIGDVVLTANDIYNGAKSVAECLEEKAGILEDTVSGSIVSFTPDKTVEYLKGVQVEINPVQDLHGYDNPWPAGGGKNKLNLNTNVTVLIGSVPSAVTITSGDGTATITENYYNRDTNKFGWEFKTEENQDYVISGLLQSTASATIKVYSSDGSLVTNYNQAANSQINHTFNSGSNTTLYFYASITSWGQTITLSNVQIEKGSTATSWSPYSNICPISGWDECKVMRAGVNLWDEEVESGYINADGSYGTNASSLRSKNFCPCVGGTTYYFNKPSSYSTTPNIVWYDVNKTFISRSATSEFPNIPAPSNARFFKISMWAYGATYNNDISINYPSTDHSYHPYQGNLYTISFGQTVYGGRLDVINGELVVENVKDTLASGVASVSTYESGVWAYTLLNVLTNRSRTNVQRGEVLSNLFKSGDSSSDFRSPFYCYATNLNVVFTTDFEMTVAEANTWLANNPLEVCYPLATPIEISLTPTQITSLKSITTMYADTGEISVDYAADLKTYILNAISNAL